ncbi:hypothetical protein V7128_01800 [Neobacillus vireti]|uniref:hypothetical protein n=1 Tax=Neobacillus vireti TaxID=220686 RepID=UPI002FFDA730
MLEDYRKDYSVYCLRVELKSLGRLKTDYPSADKAALDQIDKQMNDIRATLDLLKEKHGIKN